MTEPYIGEIRLFAGTFAPRNYAYCNGTSVSIDQNPALFSILGTTYGGDGRTNFLLPDMQGRIPVHVGQGAGLSQYRLGQRGGNETVTLTTAEMASHTHTFRADNAPANQASPANAVLAELGTINAYTTDTTYVNMAPEAVADTGAGAAHSNVLPFQCIAFIIATAGAFPQPS